MDSVKAFLSQSESCMVYIQIAFQVWWLFYWRLLCLPQIFPVKMAKGGEGSKFVLVGCSLDEFEQHQETRAH